MIEKYEALEDDQGEDNSKSFKEVEKTKATHIHKCYHDEGNGRPCRRVKK